MSREEIRQSGLYYTIIQGTFRQKVDKDHPDAVRRDYETSDGKTGTKYERIVNALYGYITDVGFYDSDYGTSLHITLDENEDGKKPIIALQLQSREAEDLMKKLPNIDLSKEIKMRPYSFEGDKGDEVRGMEVLQQNEDGEFNVKITNYFRDAEKKENINGFPNPPKENDDMEKEDWKIYFIETRRFLKNYIQDKIVPNIPIPEKPRMAKSHEEEVQEINPDDIPFNSDQQ